MLRSLQLTFVPPSEAPIIADRKFKVKVFDVMCFVFALYTTFKVSITLNINYIKENVVLVQQSLYFASSLLT